LVRICCQYGVKAQVRLGEREADGTSLLALLLLNATQGAVLTVWVVGARAAEAVAALRQQFAVPAAVSA
jgi:phosphotransferase system HPr-like phosphotransfer protein